MKAGPVLLAMIALAAIAGACGGDSKPATETPASAANTASNSPTGGNQLSGSETRAPGSATAAVTTAAGSATSQPAGSVSPSTTAATPANTVAPRGSPTPTLPPAGDASISISSASGKKDDTVELTITAEPAGNTKLGSWIVDVTYDPAVLQVAGCEIVDDSVCNPRYNDRTVRLVGLSLDGKRGELGRIKVKLLGNAGATTDVRISQPQCVAPTGASVACSGGSGTIRINP